MNKQNLIYLFIAGLVACLTFNFIKLYILSQRIDLTVVVVNAVIFPILAIGLIILIKKQKDEEEERMFRD